MRRLYVSIRASRALIRAARNPGIGNQMVLTRYTLDSVRSCVWVSGRSSLHPINTETRGITGWFEAAARDDGSLDLSQPVSGEMELAVERLTSGNQLYDRELRRRIDAKRYPTIAGRLTHIVTAGAHPDYLVRGEVAFHGKTRSFEHGMQITCTGGGIALTGEDVFDIREFGMKPPSMLMVRVYPEISVRIALHGAAGA
jgi:polyisoprenoid-binding protein YceI